jgi:nucleoside-diphosphate-sugar epimerase
VPESLEPALQGVEVVYHLAGATLVLSPDEYAVGNGLGNRAVAQACARLPAPPVVVYVSSLAAAGPAANDQPLTEATPPPPYRPTAAASCKASSTFARCAARSPSRSSGRRACLGPGTPTRSGCFARSAGTSTSCPACAIHGCPGSMSAIWSRPCCGQPSTARA